jgi:hypothetical protein
MKINKNTLLDIISKQSYEGTGDDIEKKYKVYLSTFRNHEFFWKNYIIPGSERILGDYNKIKLRSSISDKLNILFSLHYTVFLNIIYAKEAQREKQISFFENFYVHLGSCCDVAEEFLSEIYLLYCECTNIETEILQRLSKTKFLKIASVWYDKHYSNVYQYYLKKGKFPPIKLPSRTNVLLEYFGKNDFLFKNYSNISTRIRTYRNVVVHNTQMGKIVSGDEILVPKSKKINEYKSWPNIFQAAKDSNKVKNDFIDMEVQMESDIQDLVTSLDAIWPKAIKTFENLWDKKNEKFLKMYDLEIE